MTRLQGQGSAGACEEECKVVDMTQLNEDATVLFNCDFDDNQVKNRLDYQLKWIKAKVIHVSEPEVEVKVS